MATGVELRAADFLAIALEKEALLLNGRLFRYFLGLGAEGFTQTAIEGKLTEEVRSSVGALWNPQVNFLKISTEATEQDALKLAPLRWAEITQRNKAMAEAVVRFRNLQPLTDAGTLLNDVVTKQVDDTQQFEGARKGIVWTRHTDAGACDWCRDQVQNYKTTRAWLRHGNCRCFKVREDG